MAYCVVVFYNLPDGKIPYLEPKHTFKEFQMVRNTYRPSTASGCKKAKVVLNTCKPKPRYGTLDKFKIDFPVCGMEVSLV